MRALITILFLVLLSAASFAQHYTIAAPTEAHIRQSIEIEWTAADETGNMIEIRPLEEGARRGAYSYIRSNPESIEAPEQPGDYLLVFTHGGNVVASQPLRVFGHREADSCRTDLEIPLGPMDAAAVTSTIAGINAMNLARTPIGASIAHVRTDLAGATGQRVLVVLTDGEETCDGDAASEIAALRALGWDIRVNIVGFAIDDADLEQTFESWAAADNGSYFSAVDAEGLADAMTRAVATRFEVINAEGNTVASGLTGGDPITLPTGDYTISGGGREVSATILSEELTTVGLD